jgi:hypothetical protein
MLNNKFIKCIIFTLILVSSLVSAQPYPSAPIKVIVTYSPGGGSDVLARMIAPELGKNLGQPIIIDSNNYFSGQLKILSPASGLTAGAVRQTAATQFIAAATTIDLRAASKLATFNATGFNLINITNRFPGMTMMVSNIGAGTVTIDASLMSSGVASSLAAGVSKQYLVLGFGSISLT